MANETKSLNKKQRRILLAAGIALLVGIVSLAVSFSSGNLPANMSGDGAHLYGKYYTVWKNWFVAEK